MNFSLSRLTFVVATAALFAACPTPPPPPPQQECPTNRRTCDSDRVCAGGFCDKEHDSKDGVTGDGIAADKDPVGCCVIVVCSTNADCPPNEKCDVRKGICEPKNLCDPAADNGGKCDLNGDGTLVDCCQAGQFCEYTGGTPQCVSTPPAPTKCFVAAGGRPIASAAGDTEANPAIASDGSTLQLEVVGTDDAGHNTPHATFTWSGTGVDANSGILTAACATGICPVTVTATDGGASCSGVVNVYAAPTAGSQRILVLDLDTGLPISGATTAVSTGGVVTGGTTGADGTSEFPGTFESVSAFPDNYQWHTIVGPPNDVVVYTKHIPTPNKVSGIKGTFDFSKIHTQGDIKIGLSGTAIAAAITDLNFSTIIGDISKYNVDIEGITQPGGQLVPLPSGLELQLGASPIKGDFVTFGDPGRNVGWALGGAVALADVGPIISGVAGGGNVDVGNILAGVLPFFGKFDHATLTGLNLTEGDRPPGDPANPDTPIATSAWPFPTVTFIPDTLLSQAVDYTVPTLPCTAGNFNAGTGGCTAPADGSSAFQSGAVLLTGVVVPGIGLVPLGLTAGLDEPDTGTASEQDGLIEAKSDATDPPAKGHGLIDYAPPHDGLEGSMFITVALALDLNAITSTKGLGASIITHVTRKYEDTNSFPAAAFLQSEGGTFTPDDGTGATGNFQFAATDASAPDFWRINLDDGNKDEWNIWFSNPADAANIHIADFHPAPATAAARFKTADIQAFKLGAGYAANVGGPEPTAYADLFKFNGTNLDNLLYYLGAWSSQACLQQQPPAGGVTPPAPHCLDTTPVAP